MTTPVKTLVLLRHAKAEIEGGLGDRLRPLAPRGRRQSVALGARLVEVAGPFDIAMVSSALRTQETYRLLAGASPEYPHPRVLDELYGVGARHLLVALQHLPESALRVLVVGHEPTMSSLAYLLHDIRDEIAPQISLGIPTATACVVDVTVRWAELERNQGHVRGIIRPDE